ncbi:phosphotransferase enzyme family protein [Byssothecium circinans]|uniref:Phosphotransferase enzyme family protein n=1 Tax=Byssothecium circinans TaxID=147558 RepID=A0A6A5TQS4_9PLEO|nr:phosphotransferase enzyme family protein [Byssothecium circinans]
MSSSHAQLAPNEANFDVRSSSFFQHHNQLPSPDEVRTHARAQYLAGTQWGDKRRQVLDDYNTRPCPAVFESLGLFVKWGSDIKIAEGQALYAIRHYLDNAVLVPEIYGWRTDGKENFLYMEAISGRTLESVAGDRRKRPRPHLLRAPDHPQQRSITRGRLYDRAISDRYMAEAGPFTSVKEFHDWFSSLYLRRVPDPENIPDPYRQDLPDDSEIVFTHGDLHPSNILLSLEQPVKVVAIVDWEQSGWLPAYWEDRKAHFTSDSFGEWSEKYLPMIMDQYPSTWEAWNYYSLSMGF